MPRCAAPTPRCSLHDEGFAGWCLETLEAHGALVFRGLHLDDAAQVAFSRRLGEPEIKGRGEHPEIMIVSLDPTVSRMAEYLRGTVYWHIDGAQDDIPSKATLLNAHRGRRHRRRDGVREHLRRVRHARRR